MSANDLGLRDLCDRAQATIEANKLLILELRRNLGHANKALQQFQASVNELKEFALVSRDHMRTYCDQRQRLDERAHE